MWPLFKWLFTANSAVTDLVQQCLGLGRVGGRQEIRHHTIKSIGYTLTRDVHLTSIKYITRHILLGIKTVRAF